jgi:hypothetical protein
MSPVDLNAELWRAVRFAKALPPPVLLGFAELGFTRRVQWGFARVDYYGADRRLYEPQVDGHVMAFIVPVAEGHGDDNETVDLAAIDPDTQHVGTRLGYGRALGVPAIDKARFGYQLTLKERPLDWLRDPIDSCYLFDLSTLPVTLAGVDAIICTSVALAERAQSLLPPSQAGRVVMPDD